MAQRKGKKAKMPSFFKRDGQVEKKSIWSYFFEPVPDDEDDDFFSDDFDDDRPYGEPPQDDAPASLFDESELVYSADEDAAAAARLTWSDGERVVSGRRPPFPGRTR